MADQFNAGPQPPQGDGGGSGLGIGLIVGLLVIIVVVLAAVFFWPEEDVVETNMFNDTEQGIAPEGEFDDARLQGDAPTIIEDDFPAAGDNSGMGDDSPVSDDTPPLIIE